MELGLSKEELQQVFNRNRRSGESQSSKDAALLDLHERGVPDQIAKVIHNMQKEREADIQALLGVIEANNKEIEKQLRAKGFKS